MRPAAKVAILAASSICVFVVAVGILMQVLPGPRTSVDYLVIGGIATFVALLTVFFVLITTIAKTPDTFYRKRPLARDATEGSAVPPADTTPSSGPASQS